MKQSYFAEDGVWLKGNLHSHSTVTDGIHSPEELIDRYEAMGYDFLSITDHNVYVHHQQRSNGKLILLTGVEHDIAYGPDKCTHIVGTGVVGKEVPGYDCRRYTQEEFTDQQLMDMMLSDGQFVTLAHPVWSRMKPEEVLCLQGYHAVEVFNNGSEHLCHAGNAEVVWDMLLQNDVRVYATASDDCHVDWDLFGGWVWVKARERTPEAIVEALFAGQFYPSSGPVIEDFGIEDGVAYLKCSPCRSIHFITYEPRGESFFPKPGELMTQQTFPLKGRENYVRAVCVDEQGKMAWTQPIFLTEVI